MAPLGYDTKDRRITVNEPEAETVRTIFRSYLKLGSLNLSIADLRKRGIVTKVRTLKTGETVGGIPFTRGPLAHLLRNRFYIADVPFKGEILKGEQPAIVDRDLFEAVQAKLSEQVNGHKAARMKSEALLIGRIFDDRGNRMTPSHARKGGVKYRYYLSSALLQGMADGAGSVRRVPAAEIEALVVRSVREHLKPAAPIDPRSLIDTHVVRVEVQPEQLVIHLARIKTPDRQRANVDNILNVGWRKTPSTRRREILLPAGLPPQHARPIRSESRALLVASIARGRRWLDELLADATANAESIAKRERCSVRKVNMTISLAFLAPDLVKSGHRGAAASWHGSGPPRRHARRVVSAASDARTSFGVTAFEPSLCLSRSPFPGNGISGPEKNAQKRPADCSDAVSENKPSHTSPPIRGLSYTFRKSPVAYDCVVDPRGLELRARHAVLSNRSQMS